MNPSECRVRRATVDDLNSLIGLWEGMNFSPAELERRLTEFQVVEAPDGALLGAIAIEMVGRQGRLHSECFNDFALADNFRELIWDRLQTITTNHGLTRLWMQETAPFWKQTGFQTPHAEDLMKLPANWQSLPPDWLTVRLRAEEAFSGDIEKEFLQFKEQERARTETALRNARLLNQFATVAGIIIAIGVIAACIYIFKNKVHLNGR